MRWAKGLILIASTFLAPPLLLAQGEPGRISGVVADSASSQPLGSVRVIVVGTQLAAQTNAEGRYTIVNVQPGSYVVRAQRIGYAPSVRNVTVTAGQATTADFTLRVQAIQLAEVVSVGYGSQERRNVTGSVSNVTMEGRKDAPTQSIDQLLQGTAPGVQVTTASSEPGGAMSIRIRGTASITGNSEPLYVIDGFPIENDIEGSSAGNGGRERTTPPNPLVTLNPSDIESISILKDASATAIYGARGANGVVIITTKQGRGTKPQFTIDSYTGVSTVAKRYDMLSAAEYMDYANEYGQGSSTAFTPFPQAVRDSILAAGTNTDWQDLIFRSAPVSNVQLSLRGATSTSSPTRYAISAGVFDQAGVVVGSGLRRYSTRVNVDQAIGSRFELGASVTGSQARSKAVPTAGQQNANAGAVSAAIQYVPILPVRRADGTYTYIKDDLNAFNSLLDAPTTPNPVSLARDVRDSLSDTRFLGNFFGQANLRSDLKARVSLGVDYANRWRNTYYPRTTLRGQQSGGEALRGTSTTSSWLNENTLTYQRKFGAHDVTVLGGYSRQLTTLDGSSMGSTNFANDLTGYFDIGAGTPEGGPDVGSRRSTQTLESWISRVNYALLDRYLFTLTYRADGSSRFAENNKWGAFPSAAFAWRASDEPWFQGIPGLDDLKFRASYGVVGNPSIRPYQSLTRLCDQGYSFGGTATAGYYVCGIGNKDLTWESTHQVDYGVDVGLLDRLTFTADYYQKRTSNLLLAVRLPIEWGFETALANRGTVQNNGIELGLDASVFGSRSGNGFAWRTNVSFAKNDNKVLSLGVGTDGKPVEYIEADFITTDYNLPGTRIVVGQPLGKFYGFRSAGIVRDAADSASITYKNFNGGAFHPGDMKILDLDGDGQITNNDRTYIGDPTPDFTYGWTNTFSWRGVELTGLLQGSHGGKILNVNRIRTESSPRVNLSRERWTDRWTPTNTDAKYPRIGENPNQVGPNSFTDNLLESGSYLRLRTLTLSYGIPASLLSRINGSSARIYVTGTNLFTATDYSGFDPDVSSQSVGNTNRGIDIGAYPLARTITTGISVGF